MSATLTGLSVAVTLASMLQAVPAARERGAVMAENAQPGPMSGEARLDWPEPVELLVEEGPHEVVIRFDRPIAEEDIRRLAATAADYLADLRWNDDSLVMLPAAGQRMVVTKEDNGVLVRFLAEDAVTTQAPAYGDDGSLDVALARATADAAAGYPGEARKQLRDLARAYPGDRQVRRALADADAAEGRTAEAAAHYRDLDADDPLARRIIGEAGGQVATAMIYRDGKTFSQWESSLGGSAPLTAKLVAGMNVRHVRTVVESVSSDNGYLPRVRRNLTIVDATATLRPRATILLSAQASALLDEGVAGVGVRIVLGPAERQVRIFAAYRMPDYSTAEQAAFGGHISRFGAGGTVRLTPEMTMQADVARNAYGLAGAGVRTRTTQLLSGIDLLVMRRPFSLQLSYRLDAEYVDVMRRRADGTGFIPLSDRENHTLQVVMSKPLRAVQMTAAAGWTKDRYGGNGPTASLGAVASLGDAWRLEASGGVSSISRPAISGRQYFLRLAVSRALGRQ